VLTILFGFAAVNTGNNLLFLVVSAMLGFMAVSGVLGWLNIRSLRLEVQLPDEIYCSLPTQLTLQIRNQRRLLPSYLLTFTVADQAVTLPVLARGATTTCHILRTFARRGPGRLEQAYVSSPFPINFFIRSLAMPLTADYLVFPRPSRSEAPGNEGLPRRQGEQQAPRKGSDGDLAHIGEYTGAEPLKLIHWRLSARHDELLVKELAAVSGQPLIIDLAELSGTIEERLSFAAFLVNQQLRRSRLVGLKLGQRLIPPDGTRHHRLRLLGELARYGLD
jgi:uncharacterized protein (DUF58 family)